MKSFSFIIKALIISIVVFLILYAISMVSSQKSLLDSNNYGIKDSVKESINIAYYRLSGDIIFDNDTLIKSVISNYVKNNNINVDDITFEIAVDEEKNIVTVKIYSSKGILDIDSNASYTFSYQVVER